MRTLLHLALSALMTVFLSGCLVAESTYLKKVTELDALAEEQVELQNWHKALRTENTGLKAALAKLESDHDSLKEVKVRLDETVTRLEHDNNQLERDLQSSRGETPQRIAELRRKITAMEGENRRFPALSAGHKRSNSAWSDMVLSWNMRASMAAANKLFAAVIA